MMIMSRQMTPRCADLTTAGAQIPTSVALADFAGAIVTLPEMRARAAAKHCALRDVRVRPKILGMKVDDIRRFTFV
jgi:hypothetical protein